jgi:CubicO group peptidase (beta-lactamase class C family)
VTDYTESDFLHWVARWSPVDGGACSLPAPYLYSNASVGLLGVIVANAMATPWRQLVADRITGPLGMRDTAIDPADRTRLAQGHGPGGNNVIPWPVFAWYAAGALRSTAEDMLNFGEAGLGHATINGLPVPPALRDGLRLAMTPVYRPEGRPFRQALSWAVEPDNDSGAPGTMTYKDGGTDGFNSVIVVDAAKNAVVFIAANKAKSGIPLLGRALMKQLR